MTDSPEELQFTDDEPDASDNPEDAVALEVLQDETEETEDEEGVEQTDLAKALMMLPFSCRTRVAHMQAQALSHTPIWERQPNDRSIHCRSSPVFR